MFTITIATDQLPSHYRGAVRIEAGSPQSVNVSRLCPFALHTALAILEKEKTQNDTQEERNKMKNETKLIIVAAITAAFGASSGVAQRNYDPKTVETIQGKVLSVERTAPAQNRGYGVHLMLQTDKETIPVHLGPARYIDKQTPRIEANDTITVTGSRVTVDGKPAIIAAQIKKGNDILKLRDDNGIPAWRGAAQGNR